VDRFRQTGGNGIVVSNLAVFDRNVHAGSFARILRGRSRQAGRESSAT
jgi:hypothetical protein